MADFAAIRFQPSRPLLRELSADRLNSILAEIRRNKPLPGRGITVRQTGQGTAIDLAAPISRGGSSTPTRRLAWDLIPRVDPDSTDPEDPTYLIRVQPGTLNGFLPTNWDEEFTGINNNDLYFAKAIVTTDGQVISSVSIAIDDQPAAEQVPQEYSIPSPIEYVFGLFFQGAAYRIIAPGSITLRPDPWIVEPATPPAEPGEVPYSIYYRLQ